MAKSYVWRCTEQSIKNQQLSIASCVEIAWSVLLYWLIWYWFDTHWHLLSSLVAAPFLLLRSPESIKQGVAWFGSDQQIELKSVRGILTLSLIAIISFSTCWFLANIWLPQYDGLALLWRAVIIVLCGMGFTVGIGVCIGIVATSNVITAAVTVVAAFAGVTTVTLGTFALVVVGLVIVPTVAIYAVKAAKKDTEDDVEVASDAITIFLFPFIAAGIWFSAIIVRLITSLKYLLNGIRCMPSNWHENMFVIDPFHPPALIPGSKDFSVIGFKERFAINKVVTKLFITTLLPFIYIPALLYRWSIKATFWFYWPLLYIQSGKFKQVIDKATFNDNILKHPVEQLRLLLAMITFVVLVGVSFTPSTFFEIQSNNPAILMAYLLAIDIYAIKPWHWLQLATAVLTIVLWVKAWSINIAVNAAKEHNVDYDWTKTEVLRKLSRIRNLTTGFYLAIALVFMVLYLEGFKQLPQAWVVWLSAFFDTPFPQLVARS